MSTYYPEDIHPTASTRADRILRDIGLTISELEKFPQANPVEQCAELKDELRSFREDSRKKDELIQRLCGINGAPSTSASAAGRPLLSASFQLPDPTRAITRPPPSVLPSLSEVATLQVKVESLEDKLRHRDADLRHREDDMAVLRKEMELLKEENTRLHTVNQDSTKQLTESKQYKDAMEGLKARNEYALHSLQEQYRVAQEKIAQLEARLRTHLVDRDEDHKTIETWERRFTEFAHRAARLVCVADVNDVDTIMARLMDLGQENAIQKTKIDTLTAEKTHAEAEMKAAKDTVTRLTTAPPPGAPDSVANIFTRGKDYKLEVDRLTAERDDLKAQIGLFETRVKSLQTLLDSTKAELSGSLDKNSVAEGDKRQLSYSLAQAEKKHTTTLESLANLLGTADAPCVAEEGMIRDRISKLIAEAKQQQEAAAGLDQRVRHLQAQFETQYHSGKELELKTRLAETEFSDMREKLRRLEHEMAARDVLREGVLAERDRLAKQIKAMADCLKLQYNPLEFDAESTAPKIIAKCEELIGHGGPGGAGHGKCCSGHQHHVHSPPPPQHHHRIRQLNELLAAREQEVGDLQRKLAATEEIVERQLLELRSRPTMASAPGSGYMVTGPPQQMQPPQQHPNSQWMEDKIRELTNLLKLAHDEMGRLKQELMHAQELQMRNVAQDQTILKLEESLAKAERVREKQSKKITELKKSYECGMLMEKSRDDHLQVEINRLRENLDGARRRERQLLEFRAILARLVGVELRMFATAGAAKLEAEVINRVQRMMESSVQSGAIFEPFSQQRLTDFSPEFRQGYEQFLDSSAPSTLRHTPTPPTSAKSGHHHHHKKSSSSKGSSSRLRHSGSLTRSPHQQRPPSGASAHYQSLDPPTKSILKPRARSTSPPQRDDRKY